MKRVTIRRKHTSLQFFRIKFQARTSAGHRRVGIELCRERDLGERIAAITRRFDPGACTVRVRELTPAAYVMLAGMLQDEC